MAFGVNRTGSEACFYLEGIPQQTIDVSFSHGLAFVVNVLNQMFISFVAVYMSWICIRLKFVKTAFHAWFCTIGFCFLLAEGAMVFYQGNIVTHPFSHQTKTTIHLVLQAVGGAMGIVGSVQKILGKKKHFTTIHGKVGLAATVICGINMVAGLVALYSKELQQYYSPLFNKTFHSFLGILTFVLGMITQFYGYETGFFVRKVDYDFKIMIKFFTIVTTVLTIIGPLKRLIYTVLFES